MRDIDPAPKLPLSPGEKLGLAAGFVVIFGLFAAEIATNFSTAKLGVLFIVLAWAPLLVIHELGHALAARLVGWRITEIVIGYGRELAQFQVGDTRVRIKLGPVEGYVRPELVSTVGARWKSAFVYFGGPGAELLVFAGIYAMFGDELFVRGGGIARLVAQSVAVAVGLDLFYNLLPLPLGGSPNDGLGIVLSLLSRNASFASSLSAAAIHEAKRCLWLEDPAGARRALLPHSERAGKDLRIAGLLAVCTAMEGDPDAARDTLARLREAAEPGVESIELTMAQAWIDLVAGTASVLSLRDAESAAVKLQDPHSTLLYALTCFELGRYVAAYRNAMAAYRLAREAEDEGPCLAVLALASDALVQGYGHEVESLVRPDSPSRFASALERLPLGPSLRRRVASRGLRPATSKTDVR